MVKLPLGSANASLFVPPSGIVVVVTPEPDIVTGKPVLFVKLNNDVVELVSVCEPKVVLPEFLDGAELAPGEKVSTVSADGRSEERV